MTAQWIPAMVFVISSLMGLLFWVDGALMSASIFWLFALLWAGVHADDNGPLPKQTTDDVSPVSKQR